MLAFAPTDFVRSGNDDGLRAKRCQPVRHAAVTQVVANAEADSAPGRVPQVLLLGRQSVFKKLNRHTLCLPEDDFALRVHDKHRVVKF